MTPEEAMQAALDTVEESVGFTVYEAWPKADELLKAMPEGWGLAEIAHQWERFDVFLQRCTRCGWGWKFDADNDFPCPGFLIVTR